MGLKIRYVSVNRFTYDTVKIRPKWDWKLDAIVSNSFITFAFVKIRPKWDWKARSFYSWSSNKISLKSDQNGIENYTAM